jgi:nitrite reductase/ring-hydroxylating ferredoxin subunit
MLTDLPPGKPRLMRAPGGDGATGVPGQRLACVRRGDRVDVVDDRCPHEGHPLSMGLVRDGVLTCPWHNWKFDLGTGRCLFGGEAVRRYPVEVMNEEVFIDLSLDADQTRLRLEEDFVRAVAEGAVDGAVREGLRLARLEGNSRAPWAPLVRMACLRTPFGAGDALVAIEAALALADEGVIDDGEALAVAALAAADETRARSARPVPEAAPAELERDRDAFLEDLLEERRSDAVARVLGLPREARVAEVTDGWLVPFASLKLWDQGATLARVRAGAALATRLGDGGREELLAGIATSLGWAVAESDLPAWRATRVGLQEAARVEPGTAAMGDGAAAALRDAALRSEREAVDATLAAVRAGAAPALVLDVLAGAALDRLARYDLARSAKVGSAVSGWDAARAVIFAYAATRAPSGRFALAQAVMLAGVVGRLARVSLEAAEVPSAAKDDLRAAARSAALAPRCEWASRGRAASLAAACVGLGMRDERRLPVATFALTHATARDVGGGLARVAATARRLVDGAETDD